MNPAAGWSPVPVGPQLAAARRGAIGTTVQVVVHPREGLRRARLEVEGLVRRLDLEASRFRSDSELSRLNRAEGRPLQVSPMLAELVAVSLDVARSTDGAVDPTVGRCLIDAGYDRDFDEIPLDLAAAPPTPRPAAGWQEVRLTGRLAQLPPGVFLDLGSVAKAWAADRAARLAQSATGGSVLVSLGGDIATSGPEPPGGWTVRISDDHAAPLETLGQTVRLRSAGLATSSTARRSWRRQGRLMHHLIDPATGGPARGPWRTVSVAADSCLLANRASTACLVLGERGLDWLLGQGLPARLVSNDGSVLHLGGWSEEGDDLAPLSPPLAGLASRY